MLKAKIVEFVGRGDFGLASGKRADGAFERVWFQESVAAEEVAFEAGVFLLRKATAEALKTAAVATGSPTFGPVPPAPPSPEPETVPGPAPATAASTRTLRLSGTVPPEVWNRLGTRILPKLRAGSDLRIGVDFSVTVSADAGAALETELHQILQELGLASAVRIE